MIGKKALRATGAAAQCRMDKRRFGTWSDGIYIGLFCNGVSCAAGVAVTYLKHDGSTWVSPLLLGSITWLISMSVFMLVRLFRYIPRRQYRVTEKTIQPLMRDWLDGMGLKVQSVTEAATYFKFIVSTDGGKVITISRDRDYASDSLTFRALYKESEQNKSFEDFTVDEKAEARLEIQLELARAAMGYTAPDVLADFTLFRRIPITSSLSLDEVSRTLLEVEAALQSVFLTGAKLLLRKKVRSGRTFLGN